MTSGLPPRISTTRGQFVEKAYSAQLELAALPRLRDALEGDTADIQVEMELGWDKHWRRPSMHLIMHLKLSLQCQRCMQPMQWSSQVENHLLLNSGSDDFEGPEAMDIAQAEEGEVETLSLIEDEILLALPLVPLHASDTPCGKTEVDEIAEESPVDNARADNPFAALAALKTKH
ncbi:MAG: YceD family protein [Salinisphaeraceae bacterium]|nr:YceD family protein [Salinisphaeraceae bacterium]